MDKWLDLSKIAAFMCACFMFIGIGLAAGKAGALMDQAQTHDVAVTAFLNNANKTLDTVNRPCPGAKDKVVPCGTLADVNRTLATARGTLGVIEIAGRHEDQQLTKLDGQEEALYDHLHVTLTSGQKALDQGTVLLSTTNQTVKQVQPVLREAQGTVAATTAAVSSIDKLARNPNIPQTLLNVQDASKATANTMHSVQDLSATVNVKVQAASQHSLIWTIWHQLF